MSRGCRAGTGRRFATASAAGRPAAGSGGQVYLTVDDNFHIRRKNGDTAAHFVTTDGSLTLAGKLQAGVASTGTLTARGNGGVVNIEGDNHAYIQLFPQGNAAGRKGWIGYGNANVTGMTIKCESGNLALVANGDVEIAQGALLNQICIGGNKHGAVSHAYETIQLHPNHNLRIWFGTNEHFQLSRNGNFSATGSKKFVIDHPLDPEHRKLVHAAIEGPEAAVYYRGEAKLDGGSCTIRLPDYFEALTRAGSRTVQITPKFVAGGAPNSGLAATEIRDGQFDVHVISGDNPRQPFYWEVKAVRADIDSLEVEPVKD